MNDRDLVKEKASKMLKTKQVSHKAKRRDSYEGKNIVRSKVNLSQLSVASFLFFALSPCLPALCLVPVGISRIASFWLDGEITKAWSGVCMSYFDLMAIYSELL